VVFVLLYARYGYPVISEVTWKVEAPRVAAPVGFLIPRNSIKQISVALLANLMTLFENETTTGFLACSHKHRAAKKRLGKHHRACSAWKNILWRIREKAVSLM